MCVNLISSAQQAGHQLRRLLTNVLTRSLLSAVCDSASAITRFSPVLEQRFVLLRCVVVVVVVLKHAALFPVSKVHVRAGEHSVHHTQFITSVRAS